MEFREKFPHPCKFHAGMSYKNSYTIHNLIKITVKNDICHWWKFQKTRFHILKIVTDCIPVWMEFDMEWRMYTVLESLEKELWHKFLPQYVTQMIHAWYFQMDIWFHIWKIHSRFVHIFIRVRIEFRNNFSTHEINIKRYISNIVKWPVVVMEDSWLPDLSKTKTKGGVGVILTHEKKTTNELIDGQNVIGCFEIFQLISYFFSKSWMIHEILDRPWT